MFNFDRMWNAASGLVALGFVAVIVMMLATVHYAHKAGCIESMILNGVCLSDPRIDKAVKDVLNK